MELLSKIEGQNNRTNHVLFVTSQLRQREIKMAYALRCLGWCVSLIYQDTTPFKPMGHFDYYYTVKNAKEAHLLAKQLSAKVIHVFSGAIDEYISLFCQYKIAPTVIDLNDVFTPCLMDYCPERYLPTREALALADGVCARDLQAKRAQQLDGCLLPKHTILFPEYCWGTSRLPSKSTDGDDIHIVSVGTISLETYGMYDCCYLELVKKIIAHQVHFHIYPPWSYRKGYTAGANVNFERDFADYLALQAQSPYLHVHDSLPIDALAKELPQYDFGIISGGCTAFGQTYTHFKPAYVAACYSGRISDYLDAGLPILINEEVCFDYRLLMRYGVGVDLKCVLTSTFKSDLQKMKTDHQLMNNVQHMRLHYTVDKNAQRLAHFYNTIIDNTTICEAKDQPAYSLRDKMRDLWVRRFPVSLKKFINNENLFKIKDR